MNRRQLLLNSGLALPAALLGSGPAHSAATTPSTRPVGIALVGLGSYGQFVLERTSGARGARVVGLVSGDATKARQLARQCDIDPTAIYDYDSFDRIVDDDRIDAVHVCLPVGLHATYVERALAAGKHVLCEKPLAASSAEARRLMTLATARGRLLMPAYRAWFSAHLQEARRCASERTYGALVGIDAHKGFRMQLPASNWRFDPALAGGGCLYDIGIYSIQLSRWMAGAVPHRVFATLVTRPDAATGIEDHIAFVLDFGNGVAATGTASWRHRLQNRACIATENAWLTLDPATPVIGERLLIGLEQPNRIEERLLPPRDQLMEMYRHFAECVRGRAKPSIDAQDAVADLITMEALYRAAREGQWVAVEG